MTLEIRHEPLEQLDGRIIDCACGYEQEGVYVDQAGAILAYLVHLATELSAVLVVTERPGEPP